MRFARLSLERYGHFADCDVSFRAGVPDLHVIYGPNEAGKSTSMAAVSDLLFGFPTRSPYNFIYDYSLLRVGAVLEDEGQTLACRRKKGTSSTLVDANDRPLDEGPLLAMLRGQTRETFGLSFSLNQEGLRDGGRAMVEARNDLGRALFAAGSGLTGVSDELSKLEAEADAIWKPRASRPSFNAAQRDLETHGRAVREQSLKPKTWQDAKTTVAARHDDLTQAQQARDAVLAELNRIERIRRIAPSVRLRADHKLALENHAATVDIAPGRATAAEQAMADADAAQRARSTAQKLIAEAKGKIAALDADPLILARAERIDELLAASGAIAKAQQDKVRLEAELASGSLRVKRLREDTATRGSPPQRIASTKLRDLAQQYALDMSALRQIEESEADILHRRASAKTAGVAQTSGLSALIRAVDEAKALGGDIDARCVASLRKAELTAIELERALARLAPWTGDVHALSILPHMTRAEIEETRTELAETTALAALDAAKAVRSREDAATLSLDIKQLASGTAISPDEIAASRVQRSLQWQPLRDHVLTGAALALPHQSVTAFEATIAEADERSDLRYAAADESSRLADMAQRRAKLLLEAEQAEVRAMAAGKRTEAILDAWQERLTRLGYPAMEPTRFQGWLTDREEAEAAAQEATATADEARATTGRRDAVRDRLVTGLGPLPGLADGGDLATILAIAEQIRSAGEKAAQQQQLDKAAALQIERDAETLGRRRKHLEDDKTAREDRWRQLLSEAGIALDISGAIATLDALDELRGAITAQAELQARIDGIVRDTRQHQADVESIADTLGVTGASDAAARLHLLRTRLATARAAARVVEALGETIADRAAEIATETAKVEAAKDALITLMQQTGAADAGDLSAAIERSRTARALREELAQAETAIKVAGDGKTLDELIDDLRDVDVDGLAAKTQTLQAELTERNSEVDAAAAAHGDAKRVFASLETELNTAPHAASDAEQARAELGVLSEQFILKRAQAVTLRWAIEQYRRQHQDPMLLRAGKIFATLTLGRYVALRIDNDGMTPRLLGLRDDGRTVVEIGAMSEGTTDQLFLALRLAAVEQSVAAGVRLPFLADDLFVNFDDLRSEAGFKVLAELARTTQVLFFTHHPHLAAIAREVVGTEICSECSLA